MKSKQSDVVSQAKTFATKAHDGLVRHNVAKQPCIMHLGDVAGLVERAGGTEQEIAAAWLHDIVEDTKITLDDVREQFGDEVAEIVDGLTDLPHFEAMPLEERKQKQAERIKEKSRSVKLIKIADQTSNVRSLVDPPVGWDDAKCLAYIEGARRITEECLGISEFLDKEFKDVYKETLDKYTNQGQARTK